MNDEILPTEEKPNSLHHSYIPATEDSYIFLRLVGNTAQIAHADLHLADPFQLFAMGEWLKYQAKKMLLAHEKQIMRQQMEAAQNSKNKIVVPSDDLFNPNVRPENLGVG